MRPVPFTLIIGCLMLSAVSCGRVTPQIPTQRKGSAPKTDSTQTGLLELNQQLTESADEQVRIEVEKDTIPYVLCEAGTWMTVMEAGDEMSAVPEENESWTLRLRVYDLEGQLLSDSEQPYLIGRHELPAAVDKNIRTLHHGSKARLIAPWYTAYGIAGTKEVPPYENVIIEIEIR